MANLITCANGLFTAQATWALCQTDGTRIGNVTTAWATTTANGNGTAFTASTNSQVDGVALRINLRNANTSPTNTLRVWLRCHTNTTDLAWCNVAVSEIPYSTSAMQNGGWMFFKFGSPVTLATGNSYSIVANISATTPAVSLQSSNATQLAFCQLLRTTTTQTPNTGDDLYITGEWDGSANPATSIGTRLVTMDNANSSLDYGSNVNESGQREAIGISKNGILRVGGPNAGDPPAANTQYYLKLSGSLVVFSGGQLDIGTIANPIPRDSSCVIEFDTAANKQYGFSVRPTSIFNSQGLSRSSTNTTSVMCMLSSNVAIGATTLPVTGDTGWANGDEIIIAPTSRTYSEYDFRALNGAANATHLVVNTALTYAHIGTSPYWCEILNTTRNIKFRAANTASLSYAAIYHDCNTDVDWTQLDAMPITLYFDTVAVNTQFHYCSFRTPGVAATCITVGSSSADAFIFQHSTFYGYGFGSNFITVPALSTKTNWRVSDLYAIGTTAYGYNFSDEDGIIDNIYAAGVGGASTGAIALGDTVAWVNQQGNTANLYAHSCGQGVATTSSFRNGGTYNIWAYRNTAGGVMWGSQQAYIHWVNRKLMVFAWGNGTYNLNLSGAFVNCVVNGSLAGETSFATTDGIKRTSPGTTYVSVADINFDGMSFGVVAGANTTHANNDVNWTSAVNEKATLKFRNCNFLSTNQIGGFTTSGYGSSYHLSRWQQTSGGVHKSYYNYRGTVTCNTTIYRTAAPSEQLSPAITSPETKLESSIKRIALTQGATANVSVYVRKDASYNGGAPRLMQRYNPAIGLNSNDAVLATSSLAVADTWYVVTGTCAAVTDDGIIEVYVDCDGTAGSIFLDDWAAV